MNGPIAECQGPEDGVDYFPFTIFQGHTSELLSIIVVPTVRGGMGIPLTSFLFSKCTKQCPPVVGGDGRGFRRRAHPLREFMQRWKTSQETNFVELF